MQISTGVGPQIRRQNDNRSVIYRSNRNIKGVAAGNTAIIAISHRKDEAVCKIFGPVVFVFDPVVINVGLRKCPANSYHRVIIGMPEFSVCRNRGQCKYGIIIMVDCLQHGIGNFNCHAFIYGYPCIYNQLRHIIDLDVNIISVRY